MELRHLRYFVAVAERANFTAAARDLGIAQPPLSVQIQKLESEIGCPLFLRHSRRVELTPAGHQLLVDARDILRRAARAVRRIQDEAAGRVGEMTLAFTQATYSEIVTKRLRKFLRKHRGIRLLVQELEPGGDHDCDALISDFSVLPLGAVPLERSKVAVALPPKHRLSDHSEVAPADLIGETLFVPDPERRSTAEHAAIQSLEMAGIPVAIEICPGPLQARLWQVSLGRGVGFCTTSDRDCLDVRLIPMNPTMDLITALVPNPSSRCGALPLLIEAIRE